MKIPIAFSWVALAFLLSSCNNAGHSIPMMHEVSETPMKDGSEGCIWVRQAIKTKAPLEGILKFKTRDCYSEDGIHPAFGYKKNFRSDKKNGVVVSSSPADPRYPDATKPSLPILILHYVQDTSAQDFLNEYVLENADKNCVIEPNRSGEWKAGFTREFLEGRGVKIIPTEEYSNSMNGRFKEIIVADDEHFPIQEGLYECHENMYSNYRQHFFRVKDAVIFEYSPKLIDIRQQSVIDPYSVELVLNKPLTK